MLEFEEEQVPVKAEVSAPAGFVVVPIEQYNELLLAASEKPPIKVMIERYAKYPRIEAEIDKEWLFKRGVEVMREKYSEEELAEYDIKTPDTMYIGTATIAEANAEVKAAIDAAKSKEATP